MVTNFSFLLFSITNPKKKKKKRVWRRKRRCQVVCCLHRRDREFTTHQPSPPDCAVNYMCSCENGGKKIGLKKLLFE